MKNRIRALYWSGNGILLQYLFLLRSNLIYFVFQISPPSFQFQTTCARIYDILAQYDPPGQVMAFMGVIMILINIISRKKLMRYLKRDAFFFKSENIADLIIFLEVWIVPTSDTQNKPTPGCIFRVPEQSLLLSSDGLGTL